MINTIITFWARAICLIAATNIFPETGGILPSNNNTVKAITPSGIELQQFTFSHDLPTSGRTGESITLSSLDGTQPMAQKVTHAATELTTNTKNRLIVLSDIEADPDDAQSLVRLMMYANQIDIRGMIATTSVWQKNRVAPESIKKIVAAYQQVQPNLLKHEPGFPDAQVLLSCIKQGLPKYGMQGVGKGQNSEGSDWIIKVLEENDPRPLHISVWGGVNTLAQSLYHLKATKSPAELKRLIAKLRVYTISDQDDSGIWLRKNFPDLFYIVSPGDDYGSATWTAINSQIKGMSNTEISNQWLAANIQQGHGALGAAYPDVAWGMEGDTPAFLNLIPNGLNNAERPDWGGWGGRYELQKPDFSKQKKRRLGCSIRT